MANSIDQQFIEYIVKSLVGKPDAVKIERTIDEKGVLLELTVDQEDLGRVIGKRGATAQSLRTLLRALGTKNDARYNLKIVDVGGPRPPRQDDRPADDSSSQSNDASDEPAQTADSTSDDGVEPVTEDTSTVDVEDEAADEVTKEDEPSDVVSRTRAELADLDDLDV
jgi:predicted RNA-binding protein YlqC (UPF0109 family)